MPIPLIVPLDDPAVAATATRSGADALVLDLGGDAATVDRAARRRAAAGLLERHRRTPSLSARDARPMTVVRVASLASGLLEADLDVVMNGAPDAVLLPGAAGARDLQHLAAKLAIREAENGMTAGSVGIIAMPADTASGVLKLSTLPNASSRLIALAWDPTALAGHLGVGVDASPVRTARDLLLIAAAAAGVPALDLGLPRDDLGAACRAARSDGFSGRLARHAAEVPAIAAAFAPR